jgi:S1-C subfamily serine protease
MRWFYAQDHKRYGPLLFVQLAQLIKSGAIASHDWVFQEGTEKWLPAAEVPGLDLVPPPPPRQGLVPAPAASALARPDRTDSPAARAGSATETQRKEAPAGAARWGLLAMPVAMATVPFNRQRTSVDCVLAAFGYVLTTAFVAVVLVVVLSQDSTEPGGNANPPAVAAQHEPGPREKLSGSEVYQKALRSCVWILTHKSTGSGCLIDADKRLVVTNAHVVMMRDNFGNVVDAPVTIHFPCFNNDGKVIAEKGYYHRLPGQTLTGGIMGKVLKKDESRDLAIVQLNRLPPGTPAVHLAKNSPNPGESVHAIGNPGASDSLWVYTSGSVRNVYQKSWQSGPQGGPPSLNIFARVVETTVPANPGDSGGPLLNEYSELVGVTQGFSAGATLLSYAIDVSEVHTLLNSNPKDFIASGPVQK